MANIVFAGVDSVSINVIGTNLDQNTRLILNGILYPNLVPSVYDDQFGKSLVFMKNNNYGAYTVQVQGTDGLSNILTWGYSPNSDSEGVGLSAAFYLLPVAIIGGLLYYLTKNSK